MKEFDEKRLKDLFEKYKKSDKNKEVFEEIYIVNIGN